MGDMEELILALLGGLIEFLLELLTEAFLQIVGETLIALAIRSYKKIDADSKENSPVLAGAGYLLFGVACGAASFFLFPHPLVHRSRFHGTSLFISPVVSGLVMALIGFVRQRQNQRVIRLESFGYGFTFALGMALVRFFFVR